MLDTLSNFLAPLPLSHGIVAAVLSFTCLCAMLLLIGPMGSECLSPCPLRFVQDSLAAMGGGELPAFFLGL